MPKLRAAVFIAISALMVHVFAGDQITLVPKDFAQAPGDGFVSPRLGALASVGTEDAWGACELTFQGASGVYAVTITTKIEDDGECTYRILINGEKKGEFTNPRVDDNPELSHYDLYDHTWEGVQIQEGDIVRVEFNNTTNKLYDERNAPGYSYAKGRWKSLTLTPSGSVALHRCLTTPRRGKPSRTRTYTLDGRCVGDDAAFNKLKRASSILIDGSMSTRK